MNTTLILRLLDAAGNLLAWASVAAIAKGDGCLRSAKETAVLFVEHEGIVKEWVWHWPDLHVQSRIPAADGTAVFKSMNSIPVGPNEVLLELKSDSGPLPPVTVGISVDVNVPTGNLASAPVGTVDVEGGRPYDSTL